MRAGFFALRSELSLEARLDLDEIRTFASSQISGGKKLAIIYKMQTLFNQVLSPPIPKATSMDKLLAPHTPEATAHYHLTCVIFIAFHDSFSSLSSENSFTWHTDQPSVDESLISGCASYRAFERYLEGNDLFLLPRTRAELESILSVPSLY